jgi:hypothetical protein
MIDKNTGDPQHILIRGRPLHTTVEHSNIQNSTARKIVDKAISNGHVFRWKDSEGVNRYGITSAGIEETPRVDPPIYSEKDREQLNELIEIEIDREPTSKQMIGWCNQRLAELDE